MIGVGYWHRSLQCGPGDRTTLFLVVALAYPFDRSLTLVHVTCMFWCKVCHQIFNVEHVQYVTRVVTRVVCRLMLRAGLVVALFSWGGCRSGPCKRGRRCSCRLEGVVARDAKTLSRASDLVYARGAKAHA